jgi:hypothetical protein
MQDRWGRLAPLTGVLFTALTLVAFLSSSETPKADASSAKVVAYFAAHRSAIETSSILFVLAFLVLLLFAASLRSYLRRTPGAEGLSALVLAGAVLMLVGAAIAGAIEYALAHQLRHLGPETAQTLNLLDSELGLPILAGAFVFGLSSGLAIVRGAELPTWLGWVAIVLGVLAVIPPVGLVSLLGFVIWSAIVSILMYRRSGNATAASLASRGGLAAEPASP